MLNNAWAPYGISFDLLNTTYTQNATWSNDNFDGWPDMKRALRQGGYSTLNLYTTLLTKGSGLLGVSAFVFDNISPFYDTIEGKDG